MTFYHLFATMRYLSNDIIAHPTHLNPRINTSLTTELGLFPKVVSLLQNLPYIDRHYATAWDHGADDDEFLLYGRFADTRESRDPLFTGVFPDDQKIGWNDEDGQYMRRSYVALNQLGNHGTVFIRDTQTRRL